MKYKDGENSLQTSPATVVSGDAFWGLEIVAQNEEDNRQKMSVEDSAASLLRENEKTTQRHEVWREEDNKNKQDHANRKAEKEELARKKYMQLFQTATDISSIIGHSWATRPTIIFKNRRAIPSPLGGYDAPATIIPEPTRSPKGTMPLSIGTGAGFKLDITVSLPTTSTIPTNKAPHKPGTAAVSTESISVPRRGDDRAGGGAAVFDDDSSIGSFSFHAAGSAVRTKKITSYTSKKDHYAQEPFER